MATQFYKLPTVNNEDDTLSFVDAVNGLTNSVDAGLEEIVEGFKSHPYDLPIATRQQLGGVRIGDGWSAYSDGEITPKDAKYVLPPATDTTKNRLGGIIAGQNIRCDLETGTIGVDEGAYNIDTFDTNQFRDKSVTTKKINQAVATREKLDTNLYNNVASLVNSFDNPSVKKYEIKKSGEYFAYGKLYVVEIQGFRIAFFNSFESVPSATIGSGISVTPIDNAPKISTYLKESFEIPMYLYDTSLGESNELLSPAVMAKMIIEAPNDSASFELTKINTDSNREGISRKEYNMGTLSQSIRIVK